MNFDGRQEGLETPEPWLVPEVSLVVNDHPVLLQGSSGLYPAKVAEDALAGEENHLEDALRQII